MHEDPIKKWNRQNRLELIAFNLLLLTLVVLIGIIFKQHLIITWH